MNYLVSCDRFFLDAPGGAYRIAWELARRARLEGHRVAMLCGSLHGDPLAGPADYDGITVVRYRVPQLHALHPMRWHRHIEAARTALLTHLGHVNWDVAHAHTLASGLAVFRTLRTARKVYTVHSPAVLEQRVNWRNGTAAGLLKAILGERILRSSESEAMQRADLVHVLSAFTRREMVSLYGKGLEAKTVQIPWWAPQGADGPSRAEARKLLGWPQDAPLLFTLRRMERRMGLHDLLEAAEQIASRHRFWLFLAGEGPMRGELEARAAHGPMSDRVRFTGRLTDEQVRLAYRAADLFVLPTKSLECFGMIILEAYAAGCPVVATSAGAIPELIAPVQPDACRSPPGDASALAGALERFLTGEMRVPGEVALRSYASAGFSESEIWGKYREITGLGPEARGALVTPCT